MTSNNATDLDLDAIAERAAYLTEYATLTDEPLQADADQLTGEDVPALLAHIRHQETVIVELRAALEAVDAAR